MRYYRKKGFVIAAEDEATFGLIPTVIRGWAKRGSRPTATIDFQHKCTNVFGARSTCSFVFWFSKKKKQKNFLEFVRLLLRRWNRVLLFVDGARAHKGAGVRKFLHCHRKTFRLVYFPKYTPELNPTEQCWKPARKAVANRLLKTVPGLKYHLNKTFSDKRNMPKIFTYLGD